MIKTLRHTRRCVELFKHRVWVLVGVLCVLTGCTASVPRSTLDPGYDPSEVQRESLDIDYLGTHYASLEPQRVHERIVGLVDWMREQGLELHFSPHLSHAATLVALVAQHGGISSEEVQSLSQARGGVTSPINGIATYWSSRPLISAVISSHRESVLEHLNAVETTRQFGIGISKTGTGSTLVVLLADRDVALGPVPREIDETEPVSFSLKNDFEEPSVYVTGPSGKVVESEPRPVGDGFEVVLSCQGEGRHDFEILGNNREGPKVLANFPVWCDGAELPDTVAIIPKEDRYIRDAEAAEQELFLLINQSRREHGLRELEWEEEAARVARDHSFDMRDNDFFAHVSPNTGTLGDRAKNSSLRYSIIRENLSTQDSVEAIHAGLMGSPGHRSAILSPDVTRAGVGLVARLKKTQDAEGFRQQQLWVTEVFLDDPPKLDQASIRGLVDRGFKIRASDLENPKVSPRHSKVLAKIAEEVAKAYARNETAGAQAFRSNVNTLKGFQSFSMISFSGRKFDLVNDILRDAPSQGWRYGVGSTQKGEGNQRVAMVVILYGQPR